ncbi:putative glutaredoxin-C12, partial [Capsicum annuum]|uniref:putative glutaredoxin-C12 n=1 Tax=Capsicum annuum TaxID=4072 RepID=UPI001FB11DD7
ELPPHRPPCLDRQLHYTATAYGTKEQQYKEHSGGVNRKNAVIIVARFQCYMCFMLQTLMESLGAANYTVIQGEEVEEAHMLEELSKLEEGSSSSNSNGGGPRSLPAVHIGGKFVGGVDEVLTAHAKCELVPMLRAAGAI